MKGSRQLLSALLILIALASGRALAAGADRPTDPNAARIAQLAEGIRAPRPNGYIDMGLSVQDDGVYLTGPTTWTVTAENPGSYTYEYILAHDNDKWESGDVVFYTEPTPEASFTFQIMVPDDYTIEVIVQDENGNEDWCYRHFTVASSEYPTLDQLVQGVVDDCRAADVTGDYDTALWLHDWLVDHCAYDNEYVHHSAEAAFTVGIGVCDTYSKAYQLLLEAAGIDVRRLTGDGHAWNCAKLAGQWTQIDTTWDDSMSGSDLDDLYAHIYFALPDALMLLDHTCESEAPPCDTYQLYYYYRKSGMEDGAAALRELADEAVSHGCYAFGFDAPDLIGIGNYLFDRDASDISPIIYTYSAMVLSRDGGCQYAGEPIDIDIDYSVQNQYYEGCVRFDGHVLSLPDDLTEIGEEAFEGVESAMAVLLPDGAASIGPGTFAGCGNLWKVAVPASVREIADDAFRGCDHVSVACPSDSYARQFCQDHGIRCVVDDD